MGECGRWTDDDDDGSLTTFRRKDIKQFSINFSVLGHFVAVTLPIDSCSIDTFSSYLSSFFYPIKCLTTISTKEKRIENR